MKKVIIVANLLFFVLALAATDVIQLKSRKQIEGTLQGAVNSRVGILTQDGVISYYPKSQISRIYRDRQDVTLQVYENAPELMLTAAPDAVAQIDSLSSVPIVNNQMDRINSSLQMIAVPLWASVVIALIAWLSPKKPKD
ncbi:MAG: hypothetical protein LHW64_07975 [Candidatus Cloacimonetes bacterium]|jgi:hypothetical protein|nr:hypothetical protein [Candidatus Cloacimonadota bacterium]MCK9185637.1 hypothetical protein [Candidatus Cloacimonadota bacterium]MDY0230049.1 hypothetical protein [Candidatus Cloacimonadaceae bacterium]